MCGLVGIFDLRGRREIDKCLLSRMNEAQRHRGPDGSGIYVAPGIGLGCRRLAVIDIEGGHQPMLNEDDTVALVFNGEIYNFRELTDELAARGHRFRTRCDTEVIIHSWEEWGEHCLDRLRGMFAFALWDETQQTLFLARDRLGIKPLYYSLLSNDMVIFASEFQALLAHPGLKREIDPCSVEDYFAYSFIPHPRTIYKGVAKLPPAHSLTLRRDRPLTETSRYWDVAFGEPRRVNESEICEELLERLREAVSSQMVSDLRVGALLSGGVDSSAVLAVMAEASTHPIEAFSVAFDVQNYDESNFAIQVARQFDSRHSVRRVEESDVLGLVDCLAATYGEPFADSSAVPTYLLCATARERATVVQSGDGGDEVFGGYFRYLFYDRVQLAQRLLPRLLRGPIFSLWGRLLARQDRSTRPRLSPELLAEFAQSSPESYYHAAIYLDDRAREGLLSSTLRRELQGYSARDVMSRHLRPTRGQHHLSRMQYVDLKMGLPDDILTKVDRASMASSLEVRVPLLDHKFVEWCAQLPPGMRLKGTQQKYAFKKAVGSLLPAEIIHRRKMGFRIPLKNWLRGTLESSFRQLPMSRELHDVGFFDMGAVDVMVQRHFRAERDYGPTLWALLMFEAFLRRVHDAPMADLHDDRVTGSLTAAPS